MSLVCYFIILYIYPFNIIGVYHHIVIICDKGFGCNGCQSVSIMDTVIGPQNTNIPVLGRYTHARALLPYLGELSDLYGSESFQFADRESNSAQDVIDRLISQMDMVYDYVINNNNYDDNNNEWISAKNYL